MNYTIGDNEAVLGDHCYFDRGVSVIWNIFLPSFFFLVLAPHQSADNLRGNLILIPVNNFAGLARLFVAVFSRFRCVPVIKNLWLRGFFLEPVAYVLRVIPDRDSQSVLVRIIFFSLLF